MDYSLLDKIASVEDGFLATIIRAEGHTYKKPGAKALFRVGDPLPDFGNLGSLCADQELVAQGGAACAARKPRVVRIDTTTSADADLGSGTACGGVMEILLEPLGADHKSVYANVRAALETGQRCFLCHDIDTGDLEVRVDAPEPDARGLVERLTPPRRVVVFGATPLALRLESILRPTGFDVHVVDWRSTYLEGMSGVAASRLHLGGLESVPVDDRSYVVVVSHSYRRDLQALRVALDAGAAYVGLLSSRPRRDGMFGDLAADGVSREQLKRVSSPVGLDIGGRTDSAIALSIAAELVQMEAK